MSGGVDAGDWGAKGRRCRGLPMICPLTFPLIDVREAAASATVYMGKITWA